MNLLVIIKQGSLINQTLSTIRFDQFGSPTDITFIICESWQGGYLKAKSLGYKFALFVAAGTVFRDIKLFLDMLRQYPHKGLVGHLLDPKDSGEFYFLDQQCLLLDIEKFHKDDFTEGTFTCSLPQRSPDNLHDDYTPIWLRPGSGESLVWTSRRFGQKLLAQQLSNDIAVNWNTTLRDNKRFLYTKEDLDQWLTDQQDYVDLAENQLWVFNNEPIPLGDQHLLVSPASGLCWIKNLVVADVKAISLVDISSIQLDLARLLWTEWDGTNYGQFVYDFIINREIIHINLDKTSMSQIDRLRLKSEKFFVSQVNSIFDEQMSDVNDFASKWIEIKSIKQVTFAYDDMIKFLPRYIQQQTGKFNLWISNILDYKYSLIKNSFEEYEQFTEALNDPKVIRIYG